MMVEFPFTLWLFNILLPKIDDKGLFLDYFLMIYLLETVTSQFATLNHPYVWDKLMVNIPLNPNFDYIHIYIYI